MLHPIFRILVSKPELLADHVAGYGHLVAQQAAEIKTHLQRSVWLAVTVVIGAGVGLGLGGMALLLAGALPLDRMPMPWLLVVVPLTPLLVAAGAALALRRRPAAHALNTLREQLAADAAMLHEAGASS